MPEVVAVTHKPSTADVEMNPPVRHLNFHVLSMAHLLYGPWVYWQPPRKLQIREKGIWLLRNASHAGLQSPRAHVIHVCALTNMYQHTHKTHENNQVQPYEIGIDIYR